MDKVNTTQDGHINNVLVYKTSNNELKCQINIVWVERIGGELTPTKTEAWYKCVNLEKALKVQKTHPDAPAMKED